MFLLLIGVSLIAGYSLDPVKVIKHRSKNNNKRNIQIHNTSIFKNINLENELKDRVILNCTSLEDVELMFYKNVNAYNWFPPEKVLDSLIIEGYKFAAFKSHLNQKLPDYILSNKDILIIDQELK
jgi:hypothetical protein